MFLARHAYLNLDTNIDVAVSDDSAHTQTPKAKYVSDLEGTYTPSAMIVLADAFRLGDCFGTVSIGFGETTELAKHDACLLALSVLLLVDSNKVLFGDGCWKHLGMDQTGTVKLLSSLVLWREQRPVIAIAIPEKKNYMGNHGWLSNVAWLRPCDSESVLHAHAALAPPQYQYQAEGGHGFSCPDRLQALSHNPEVGSSAMSLHLACLRMRESQVLASDRTYKKCGHWRN
jgi:hypothetical protein